MSTKIYKNGDISISNRVEVPDYIQDGLIAHFDCNHIGSDGLKDLRNVNDKTIWYNLKNESEYATFKLVDMDTYDEYEEFDVSAGLYLYHDGITHAFADIDFSNDHTSSGTTTEIAYTESGTLKYKKLSGDYSLGFEFFDQAFGDNIKSIRVYNRILSADERNHNKEVDTANFG